MTSPALPAPIPDVLELSIPVPPASLERARADRDGLARLLDGEHQAAADFLVQARAWVTFWNRDMGDSSLRLR